MPDENLASLFGHLESQLRTLDAMITLAHLDDSRTAGLLPAIRSQLDVVTQTVESLLNTARAEGGGARRSRSSLEAAAGICLSGRQRAAADRPVGGVEPADASAA